MNINEADFQAIKEKLAKGEISLAQANVELVVARKVILVVNSIPRDIRVALSTAVKTGQLKHMKKDGHKPECYYIAECENEANKERQEVANNVILALSKICI